MRVILEVISGPQARTEIALAGHQKATFGRTNWADYQFPADTLMSGKHFSVECDGQTCLVCDLNSTNGTYIDDERVIEGPAHSGAIIRAGYTKLKVTLEDVESAAPLRAIWTGEAPASDVLVTPLGAPLLFIPSQMGETDATRPFDDGLAHPDALVRRNAMLAAAWTGRKWVLEYCRRLAAPPLAENWEALLLLAILGQPSDMERILTIARTADLGPRRFAILGAFGHPLVMKDLLIGIESKNPAIAAAAGAAFTKITSADINSDQRAELPPEEGAAADEFEQEFLDEVTLPNPELAARKWKQLKGRFAQGLRWCRGIDMSHGLPEGALETLDLEARWEACLRGRFEGTWKRTSLDLEQLAGKLSS